MHLKKKIEGELFDLTRKNPNQT